MAREATPLGLAHRDARGQAPGPWSCDGRRFGDVTTYVLVPGAFHGGWVWSPVADVLRRRGHCAVAVTLTGLGERRHLLSPDLGVDTHITDLVNTIAYRDLSDVTLVLHSYAGVLAGPVVERAEGRIAQVILAGGFLAHPGESNFTVEPPASVAAFTRLADEKGQGWRIPVQRAFLERWGIVDPELVDYVWPRLTDFPLRCSTDIVSYDAGVLSGLPRTYIEHTSPDLPALDVSIERARAEGWRMLSIAAGHDFMLERPEETADLLEL